MPTALLATMSGDLYGERPFRWPVWWPDEVDRHHVTIWRDRAAIAEVNVAWGPRAILDSAGDMVGHAGFHLPPQPLEAALDDPTFVGRRHPAAIGVVEVGYTVFPAYRRRGYASEALTILIEWAEHTREVDAVLAAVTPNNTASLRVLQRVGGFGEIGTCQTTDGEIEVVHRRDL